MIFSTVSIMTDYDVNYILYSPEDYLDDECDDVHLIRVSFSDGYNVDIFMGCDEDGYYLYIEDDEHAAYEYVEEGRSAAQICEELLDIATNRKEF